MKPTGRFITFEGTEGAGKSTQLTLLRERLTQTGRAVLALREPGGTAIGEQIRDILQHRAENQAMTPEAELLLFNASRAQLVREVIRPALENGVTVLCDRFYDSTIAYQAFGRGLPLAFVQELIAFAAGSTHPDLTILLTIPAKLSAARRAQRELESAALPDRMEKAGRDFFQRVEEGYRWVAARAPERVRVIDSSQPLDEVSAAIWEMVEKLMAVE